MTDMITTYLVVVLLVSLGFFGVGALASATEVRDPTRPPAFAPQQFRQADRDASRPQQTAVPGVPEAGSLHLDPR